MNLHGFLYFSPGNLSKDSCKAKYIKENVIFLSFFYSWSLFCLFKRKIQDEIGAPQNINICSFLLLKVMCVGVQHESMVKLSYHINSSDMNCVPILKRGQGATLNTILLFLSSQWVLLELPVCQVFLICGDGGGLYPVFQLMSISHWNLVT